MVERGIKSTVAQAPGLPGLMDDRAADDLASWFCHHIDPDGPRDELSGEGARLPTRDERSLIEARQRSLNAALRPVGESMTDKDALARALAEFFLGYPSLRNADAEVMLAAYVSDLAQCPLFAIKMALGDIKQGRVFDVDKNGRKTPISPDYPPSTPRIIAQAQKRAEPTYGLRAQAVAALGVKRLAITVSPERQEAVGRKMKELAAHLSMKRIEDEAREEEARRASREKAARQNERRIEAEREAAGLPPTPDGSVVVSPQLAAIVGRWREENESFTHSPEGKRRAADDAAREEYMAERRGR